MPINFALLHLAVTSALIIFYDVRDHKIYRSHITLALALSVFFISVNSLTFGFVNYLVFELLHRLTKKGLGKGDVRLSLLIGIYIGHFSPHWQTWVYSNAISWILGGIVAMSLLLLRRKRLGDRLAFAPFMFVGLYLSLVI